MYQIGYSEVSRILAFHFKMLGLWFPKKFSLFYFVYASLLYAIFSVTYVFCMLANLVLSTEMDGAIQSLFMTLTCLALLCKTLNFHWFNRDMQNHLDVISDFELENEGEVDFVAKRVKLYRHVWLSFYLIINITGATAYFAPLFSKERQLPFMAWYPFDWKNNERNYWIAYAYQVIGMIVQANLNVCNDTFPGYLMYMAHVKMDILSLRLQRNYNDPKEKREPVRCLVECIKVHQRISK